MEKIVRLLFDTGINLYKSFEIDFGDVTFNAWWFVLGIAVLVCVAEIVGKILQ